MILKINRSLSYSYIYSGSQLAQMKVGSNTLNFTYDAAGIPLAVTYNGTKYYYTTNVQGDVVAILDSNGTEVASYTYDAWGNCLTAPTSGVGLHNPLRYRGYVYDRETELYYLQSRYYDPKVGRFLNADGLVSTGQGFTGNNMFAYCNNNPVGYRDTFGLRPYSTLEGTGEVSLPVPRRKRNSAIDEPRQESALEKLINATTITKRTITSRGKTFVTFDIAVRSDAFLELSDSWREIKKYAEEYADIMYILIKAEASADDYPRHLIMSETHIYSELMAHLVIWDQIQYPSTEIANLNVDESREYVLWLMELFGYNFQEVFTL